MGKEYTCNAGDNPWARKIPWRTKWQPTPVFLPGKSHSVHRVARSQTWLKRLSMPVTSIPPPASQSSWASSWETSPRSPDGKVQWQGLWKSFECLFRGAFAYWLVWRVTVFLLACASFLNLMLFQPVDLLGLSEGLKPASINQRQEMPTCMGFIRDDRPFSWEKDGDHPEI